MGLVYTFLMLVPLAFAFASPQASFITYGAMVVAFMSFTMLGRWDVVTVRPRRGAAVDGKPSGTHRHTHTPPR